MDTGAQGIRLGEAAATGATAITVEKHKSNFKAQHGTFADKPSQNITRWLQKAQDYKDAHMIQSLEMGSILIHCITGEPAVKIRRLLEVPGDHYKHAIISVSKTYKLQSYIHHIYLDKKKRMK